LILGLVLGWIAGLALITRERLRIDFLRIRARLTRARYWHCRAARRSRHLSHWQRDLVMKDSK
jgi:hypothetical protein